MNKMKWFVDKYYAGTLPYIIKNTHKNFGSIVMPTGTGKSGVVYEDIVNTINNNPKGHKIIINISCPILKLTEQFINDFFEVAKEIYKNENRFSFFINSSDNGNKYNDAVESMNIDVDYFKDITKKFINNDFSDIAIVASCHKSLYKFIDKAKTFQNSGVEVISYLDEAHLLDIHKNNENKDTEFADINKLCMHSNKVYAFTATPDPEVVNIINKWNISTSQKYLYHKRPVDAIDENIIVPPLVNYIQTECSEITCKMLASIMKDAQNGNPNIKHKILVTLKSAEELLAKRKELESLGYKVFSTCSQFGYGTDDTVDEKYKDVVEFINDIDTYDGDCFVLHIRQLIQGIDIKSLTDCVIWSAQNGDQKNYRHTIQIIGRILRPLSNERGMLRNLRKKKVGRVYFISPADNDKVQNNISNFICRYYGFDNVDFEIKSYTQDGLIEDDLFDNLQKPKFKSGWDNTDIIELLVNIEDYIKEKILPKINLYKQLGIKYNIEGEASDILRQFDAFDAEWNTSDLLENKDLLDKVRELFEKHQIDCNPLF